MIDSKGSLVVVGEQGPGGRLAGVVVVPDRRGQREDALQHPHGHSCRGVAAVAFQVQLALEGLVDRLDDLPQRAEQPRAGPAGLAGTGRAQQPHATTGTTTATGSKPSWP